MHEQRPHYFRVLHNCFSHTVHLQSLLEIPPWAGSSLLKTQEECSRVSASSLSQLCLLGSAWFEVKSGLVYPAFTIVSHSSSFRSLSSAESVIYTQHVQLWAIPVMSYTHIYTFWIRVRTLVSGTSSSGMSISQIFTPHNPKKASHGHQFTYEKKLLALYFKKVHVSDYVYTLLIIAHQHTCKANKSYGSLDPQT